jgi:hypothetical protein
MTSTEDQVAIPFSIPDPPTLERHHEDAAGENVAAAEEARDAMTSALSGTSAYDKILLRAAAGAGKSHALVQMVQSALSHTRCARVAVTAFANKQVFPLARDLGRALGRERVCLFVAGDRVGDVPAEVVPHVTVAAQSAAIPEDCTVVLGTSHKLGAFNEQARLLGNLGPAANGETVFDVLFVDEAWQLPLHRYAAVERLAPISVGVGDVGQLPPIDPGENPWRGDPGYNPYRAWPTEYESSETTFAVDLPCVWRPTAAQIGLWRAFYRDWERLDCVTAPGDRGIELPELTGDSADVWGTVATGTPVGCPTLKRPTSTNRSWRSSRRWWVTSSQVGSRASPSDTTAEAGLRDPHG